MTYILDWYIINLINYVRNKASAALPTRAITAPFPLRRMSLECFYHTETCFNITSLRTFRLHISLMQCFYCFLLGNLSFILFKTMGTPRSPLKTLPTVFSRFMHGIIFSETADRTHGGGYFIRLFPMKRKVRLKNWLTTKTRSKPLPSICTARESLRKNRTGQRPNSRRRTALHAITVRTVIIRTAIRKRIITKTAKSLTTTTNSAQTVRISVRPCFR